MAIDFSPMLSALVPTDIVAVVLSVGAVLAVIYVLVWSVVAVLVALRGGNIQDQLRFIHQKAFIEPHFRRRYRRQQRNAEYRAWKKRNKYF